LPAALVPGAAHTVGEFTHRAALHDGLPNTPACSSRPIDVACCQGGMQALRVALRKVRQPDHAGGAVRRNAGLPSPIKLNHRW
jgi:hypothetical protein